MYGFFDDKLLSADTSLRRSRRSHERDVLAVLPGPPLGPHRGGFTDANRRARVAARRERTRGADLGMPVAVDLEQAAIDAVRVACGVRDRRAEAGLRFR